LKTNRVQTFLFFAAATRTVTVLRLRYHTIWLLFLFLFRISRSHDQTEQCTCSISLNTFGTQLRVIEALFAEGIYMVQRGHDGPTTSGCDKMMTKDERRKRGPSESGTHASAHLPKSSFQKGWRNLLGGMNMVEPSTTRTSKNAGS
jgi:hypothetical protein